MLPRGFKTAKGNPALQGSISYADSCGVQHQPCAKRKSQISAGRSTLRITIPDDEILTHRRVALLELVQKHIRTRDMLELVNELAGLLEQWAYPKEQFRNLHTMKLINY